MPKSQNRIISKIENETNKKKNKFKLITKNRKCRYAGCTSTANIVHIPDWHLIFIDQIQNEIHFNYNNFQCIRINIPWLCVYMAQFTGLILKSTKQTRSSDKFSYSGIFWFYLLCATQDQGPL